MWVFQFLLKFKYTYNVCTYPVVSLVRKLQICFIADELTNVKKIHKTNVDL